MKRIFLSWLGLAVVMIAWAQSSSSYAFESDMPVFMDRIKQELTFPLAWGNSPVQDFDVWRETARNKVFECMLTPPPPTTDYAMEVLAEEQRQGYTARRIEFTLTGYSRVPAYVLIPDGEGPFPGVVLLHDHGGHFSIGKEKMIKPFAVDTAVINDADRWIAQCYDGQYVGDYLAANGYAVISIDALFWGERGRKESIRPESQQAVACNFGLLGRSWSGFISYEDVYTAGFLASLSQVDGERVGCMGFSMGAYRAWMLSALTDQVKASAAICWMNTADRQMSWDVRNTGNSTFSMMLPGLRQYLDYPHIASIACPKPLLIFNGRHDKLFPVDGVEKAHQVMRQVWESQLAGERLTTKLWDTPHTCSKEMQAEVLNFFKKWL
ncbi:dienelactone hydrolase family protein [Bacteroides sp. OttesenSCG-928-J23]|nr:dienelactone hydrolase family protein [Bacteroides sp. OttesenSCG-928-J23]